jgi:hypothetical protein
MVNADFEGFFRKEKKSNDIYVKGLPRMQMPVKIWVITIVGLICMFLMVDDRLIGIWYVSLEKYMFTSLFLIAQFVLLLSCRI